MLRKVVCFSFLLMGATALFAQDQETGHWPVTLGFKGGIPVTQMFSTGSSGGTSAVFQTFTSSTPRYEFGPSAEFHLPFHLRFEVDGLYKRGGFDSSFGNLSGVPGYTRTSFNQWEIPGLFKYNISLGHFRPFIDFGASYRHISTIDEATYLAGFATCILG